MKNTFYTLILGCCIALASCENYLEEIPKHELTDITAITNLEKGKAALGGVYSSFNTDDWTAGLYVALATKSGFINGSSGGEYAMSYTQESGGGNSYWKAFYKSLNRANFAITGIETIPNESVPSEAEREALLGEARCLRAWINANLLWHFGHWWAADDDIYGILYRDEQVTLTNVMQKRITVGESYEKIFRDLDYAIEKMDDFTSPRYFSKQFAQALKAKILLFRAGYTNNNTDLTSALALVNDVLTTAPGSFQMEQDMQELYDNSWDSKENLFVRYLEDGKHHSWKFPNKWYPNYLTFIGERLPLNSGATETAGIEYGLDWFKLDGRWPIATGPVRSPRYWDNVNIYTFKKVCRKGEYLGKVEGSPADNYAVYHFRYAELYLMKAELLARTGATISEAIAPINEMRAARTNPVLPALAPATQSELMDLIFKEYWMELCLENGSEFFASVRFQKDAQPYIVSVKDGQIFEENKMCYPIPDNEIQNNKLMVQNPGLE